MKKSNYIYTLEELKFNLPDYISGKIYDDNLNKSIQDELIINPDFRKEADQITETLNFLEKTEFSSPAETYFANLSVRINERAEMIKKIKPGFFEGLFSRKKYLIPLIPAMILAIFLIVNYSSNNNKIAEINETKKTNSGFTEKNTDTITINNQNYEIKKENDLKNYTSDTELKTSSISENTGTKINKRTKTYKNSVTKYQGNSTSEPNETDDLNKQNENLFSGNISQYFTDNTDEFSESIDAEDEQDILFDTDSEEDEELEIEFRDLDPQEQQEILEIINNSKI